MRIIDYHEFKEAKERYESAIGKKAPITFEEWFTLPDSHKAAALFINFYNQITLAWTKAKADFVEDEDGLSTVMQYLMKNVPIIETNPNKYSETYIYRVAYNCMGCLRRSKADIARYKECVSEWHSKDSCYGGSDESSYFDFIGMDELADKLHLAADILYDLYGELDRDEKAVINNILKGTRLTKKSKERESEIYTTLRYAFRRFAADFATPSLICNNFADVLKYDDLIESAVVIMRDGTKAVYCGEKRISPNSKTEIVFFGPTQDYVMPINLTYDLEVIEVEMYD
jgi:hypothetical protein